MQELAADEGSDDVRGWLQRIYAYFFLADMFASVSSNENLMRIHSTAEEYDKATEELFAPMQVTIFPSCAMPFALLHTCVLATGHQLGG